MMQTNRNIPPIPSPSRHSGIVLLVVLWAVTLLVVVCLSLGATVFLGQSQVRSLQSQTQIQQDIFSGMAIAQVILLRDAPSVDHLGENWARLDGDESVRSLSPAAEASLALPEGIRIRLTDEAARLNANTTTAEMLAKIPGMTPAAAEAFIALRDSPAPAGSGDTLVVPLTFQRGRLASLAQLAAALEMSFEQTGLDDSVATDQELRLPLLPPESYLQHWPIRLATVMSYLTIHSQQRNLDAAGQLRVNLNTASQSHLLEQLGDIFSQRQVRAIITARTQRPFESIGELLIRPLYLPGLLGKGPRIWIDRAQLRQAADRLTVTDATILRGLVNIHTADQEVLACLPGLQPKDIEAILTQQQQWEMTVEPPFEGIGWLLDVLSEESFAEVCPYVTSRTQQFRLEIQSIPAKPEGTVGVIIPNRRVLAVLERDRGRCHVLLWLDWRQTTFHVDNDFGYVRLFPAVLRPVTMVGNERPCPTGGRFLL